ncbi:MAG: PspC domain-containing protein, partial [Pedobacter sp.]
VEEGEEQPVINASFQQQATDKKLYRDMDERVIAGVCAGIAHYLNFDAKWIRLAMILLAFVGGSGILVYVILWIIMPKATSRIEKMEMRGEPANLQGFQRNLDEELQSVKERLAEANKHAQPIFTRFGMFIGEFFEWLGRFISGSGKLIFKIIAGCIIVFGAGLLLALIVCTAAFMGFLDSSVYDLFPFSIVSESYRGVILFWAFITLFIPLLALVLFSIRVAFNRQAINKTLSFALLIIWLAGVAGTGYYVAKISSEFKEHAELTQSTDLKSFATYTIDIDKSKYFSKEDSAAYRIDDSNKNQIVVDDYGDHPFRMPSSVRISIEKSEGPASITQTYESQGKTFQVALQNARSINYNFTQRDDKLIFNPRFQLVKGTTWRNQEVWIKLKIPVGTKLILKHDSYRYINNYGAWDCEDKENDNDDFSTWVMTEDGLRCIAQLKEEALNKKKLNNELLDLEQLRKDRNTDTVYQDSITNRIR